MNKRVVASAAALALAAAGLAGWYGSRTTAAAAKNAARPPIAGDYVVIQLNDDPDGSPGTSMVKQLVAKTPTQLKLLQHNPAKEFAVSLTKVKAVHKVLSLRELLGV